MKNFKTLFYEVFRKSPRQFLEVWARAWPYLLAFAVVDEVTTYVAVTWASQINPNPIYPNILKFLFGLFFSILALLIYQPIIHFVSHKQSIQLYDHIHKYASPLVIESLRALGRISIASLAFLIPGVVLWIRYYFVVNVVQFYKPYDEGKVDALEKSRQLSMGRFWHVSFLVILTNLPYVLTLAFEFDPYAFYGIKPTLLLNLIGELYAQILFYNLFTVLINMNGGLHETKI